MQRGVLGVALALAALVALPVAVQATDARGNHATYHFVAGMAPAVGPDQATASNGSTVDLTGSGTFMAGPGMFASGGGTYTIKNASGSVTSTGSWTVTGMQGFVNYGDGAAQGLPGVNGGQLRVMVALSNGTAGVLTVTCELGSPPAGQHEGVTLVLGPGGNYTKSTGGETAFVPA